MQASHHASPCTPLPSQAQPAAAAAAAAGGDGKKGPTPEQLVAIKAAIANAATMEEIRRLEQALVTVSGE